MDDKDKWMSSKAMLPRALMRMTTNLVSIVDNVGVQIHSIAGRLNAFIAIKAAGQVDVLGVACGKKEYLTMSGDCAALQSKPVFQNTAHLKSEVKVKGLVFLCSMDYIYSPLREHVAIIGAIQAPATKRGVPPAVSHDTGFLVWRLVLFGLHTSPVKC